jgi:hypothetical protein
MNISIIVSAPDAVSCTLTLPIRLVLAGAAGELNLRVSGNPAATTLAGVADVSDGVGPYAGFFWSNWCGAERPPFVARASATTHQVATVRLSVAPACGDRSRPSTLTLQVTGPPPTVHPQPR